ncbi:peptidoglycan-binding protein [Pseudenhygromyxa sp. WMMC2535]|uniref:peptidoglycan-binding protein n=1 Tax=Pseudenhygromyxa sp. WMMC2535 TaxID=2712867 RepID=UPI0015547273|nr:peptidoglycan-binding protein [Pseudenhygromyxa sp. WMMC2535]NVB40518.1 peptidoglycan-binding protein [Pseudenhygromyxa sp. WMMC2535]
MPTITLRQGDDLTSIAQANGFDPATIWDHPDNAELQELRSNPHALLPGDRLVVPKREEREEPVATGTSKTFYLSTGPVKLRLRLTKHGQPRAGEAFELEFEDQNTISGSTDGDGWIDQVIPHDAKRVTLRLGEDGSEEHLLDLGHLDPHDSPSGIQQRLRNLGYYMDEIDGKLGPMSKAAVRAFQEAEGLSVDGVPGPNTLAKLYEVYGG